MAYEKRSYPDNKFHGRAEVFAASAYPRASLSRAVRQGRVRRLARGIYTSNLDDPAREVIDRNRLELTAILFPGCVIGDRSAVSGGMPEADGSLFVISDSDREAQVEHLMFRSRRGAPAQPGDMAFPAGIHIAGTARSLLENARPSRARGGRAPRTLSRRELEEWIDRLLDQRGEAGINRLRDEARSLAKTLKLEQELALIDRLIGSALGTRKARLSSPVLRARSEGHAFDPARLELLETLRRELQRLAPRIRPADPEEPRLRFLPFFEAYFSNYIEGTRFEIEEARAIVFEQKIPEARPADAHDIIGTYALVSDHHEMRRTPRNANDYLELLRSRHARLMEKRPDGQPGAFKREPNRAGTTIFVSPDRVAGTLERGFELYASLADPFQRAVYQMFLVSEVHPFADGNGRIARVMMSSELVVASEQRILVPTVYRDEYLGSLRALSHNGRAEALIRVLDFAQRYTQSVDYSDFEHARELLESSNAFAEPADAEREGLRLRIPEPSGTG
jgi:Fic family protein